MDELDLHAEGANLTRLGKYCASIFFNKYPESVTKEEVATGKYLYIAIKAGIIPEVILENLGKWHPEYRR